MTLWHLPEDNLGKNPYGQLLMQSLRERGVRVVAVPYSHLFARRALRDKPDVIHFQFIAPYVLPAGPSRAVIDGRRRRIDLTRSDCACLFSGGLDSYVDTCFGAPVGSAC